MRLYNEIVSAVKAMCTDQGRFTKYPAGYQLDYAESRSMEDLTEPTTMKPSHPVRHRRAKSATGVRQPDSRSATYCRQVPVGSAAGIRRPALRLGEDTIPDMTNVIFDENKNTSKHKAYQLTGRPSSAVIRSTERNPNTAPRPWSAMSCRTHLNITRDSYSAAGPGPTYPDRHSKCHGFTRIHQQLLMRRPQEACRFNSEHSRPVSVLSEQTPDRQEYKLHTNRPASAPVSGREFKGLPESNYVFRGTLPHFCKIVKKLHLHPRPPTSPARHTPARGHRDDTGPIHTDYLRRSRSAPRWSSRRPTHAQDEKVENDEEEETEDVRVPTVTVARKAGSTWIPASIPRHEEPSTTDYDNADIEREVKNVPEIPTAWDVEDDKVEDTAQTDTHSPRVDDVITPSHTPQEPVPSRPVTPTANRRSSIKKKERRESLPKRKKKEEKEPVKTIMSEILQNEDKDPEPKDPTPQKSRVARVPELPDSKKDSGEKTGKQEKSTKSFITPTTDLPYRFDMGEIDDLDKVTRMYDHTSDPTPGKENARTARSEFGRRLFGIRNQDLAAMLEAERLRDEKNKGQQAWMRGRLALSQQASRFELPMDMRLLEKMTPQEYLRNFCVITSRRQVLYQKVFQKYKDKSGQLGTKDLEKALKDVLINTVETQDVQNMWELVCLEDNDKVDYKLFAGMAAMAERILYPKFLTEDTQDIGAHKKEKIECADFCSLKWKFQGISVNPPVRKILESL